MKRPEPPKNVDTGYTRRSIFVPLVLFVLFVLSILAVTWGLSAPVTIRYSDPNEPPKPLQIRYAISDPNTRPDWTLDEAFAWYVRLDSQLKEIFKLQIRTLDDTDGSYIVYISPTGSKYHTYDCRYVTENSKPAIRSSLPAKFQPCKVCKPVIPEPADPNDVPVKEIGK